jgi:hypothetical protein
MHVPAGVPHAFANRSGTPVRMFFQSSVPGGTRTTFENSLNYCAAVDRQIRRQSADCASAMTWFSSPPCAPAGNKSDRGITGDVMRLLPVSD